MPDAMAVDVEQDGDDGGVAPRSRRLRVVAVALLGLLLGLLCFRLYFAVTVGADLQRIEEIVAEIEGPGTGPSAPDGDGALSEPCGLWADVTVDTWGRFVTIQWFHTSGADPVGELFSRMDEEGISRDLVRPGSIFGVHSCDPA